MCMSHCGSGSCDSHDNSCGGSSDSSNNSLVVVGV